MTTEQSKGQPESLPDTLREPPGFDRILEYYSMRFYCGNCGNHNHRYIKKGVRKPDGVECDNCGCNTK